MRPHKTPVKKSGKNPTQSDSDISDDDTQFRSPDVNEATDYGLEFSTSHITPRRHPSSTLRKSERKPQRDAESSYSNEESPSNQRQTPRTSARHSAKTTVGQSKGNVETSDDDDEEENQPPNIQPTKRATNQPPRPVGTSAMNRNSARAPPPQRSQARRKQTNPEHREMKMMKEIERLRRLDRFLIPRLPFSRLVRELLLEQNSSVYMVTIGALEALQTSSEMYLTQRFEDAYLMTKFRGRVTLEVRDLAVVAYFCRTFGRL